MSHISTTGSWSVTTATNPHQPPPACLVPFIQDTRHVYITHSTVETFACLIPSAAANRISEQEGLSRFDRASLDDDDIYNTWLTSDGVLTLPCWGNYHVLRDYGSCLDSLIIGALNGYFDETDQDTRWEFLKAIRRVNTVALLDESTITKALPHLPCPSRLRIHLQRKRGMPCGMRGLMAALKNWKSEGEMPREVTLTGFKHASQPFVEDALLGDVNVIDLRTSCTVSHRV